MDHIVVPRGDTPVSCESKASRRCPVFINEIPGSLHTGSIYKAEISCSANNPVFECAYFHVEFNGTKRGFFVPMGSFPSSQTIDFYEAIYVRVIAEYKKP